MPPARHPASSFDVFNVYFERIYDPTMHVVFTFDGGIEAEVMREATMRLIASDPYLRSRGLKFGALRKTCQLTS